MRTDVDRQRLARAIAEFWRGGAGPSHNDISRVFDYCDLPMEDLAGNKYDRVHDAIASASNEVLPLLLRSLIELLNETSLFDSTSQWAADPAVMANAVKRLAPFGLRLSDTGVLSGPSSLPAASAALTAVPDIHEHIRRLNVALDTTDSELLLGSSKELLETTSKFVLDQLGESAPSSFPALLSAALAVLGLHAKGVAEGDHAAATRQILGGLQQIATGVNELRNRYGTGHGRLNTSRLSLRHARMAAGAATTLAGLMIETFEDPTAPWRTRTGS
jgi:hypothetical protein